MITEHYEMTSPKQATQECQPNYEQLIESAKHRLDKCNDLLQAIYNYTGDIKVQGTLAEMIGELVTEQRSLEQRINQLMDQMEKG